MRKKYFFILLIFSIGFILLGIGFYNLIFADPIVYFTTNGRTPFQLKVANGTIELILGLGCIIGSVIRWRTRNQIEPKRKWIKRNNTRYNHR